MAPLERLKRIELSSRAWKARVLPLHHNRIIFWRTVLESHQPKRLCRPLHKLLCQRLYIGGVRETRTLKTFPFYSFRNCCNCHSAITPIGRESETRTQRTFYNARLLSKQVYLPILPTLGGGKTGLRSQLFLFKEHFA